MSERVPTEQEWGLVMGEMPTPEYQWSRGSHQYICRMEYNAHYGQGKWVPFHPDADHNDLARFVEAMQGEFGIQRTHYPDGKTSTTVDRLRDANGKELQQPYQAGEVCNSTDRIATFWACVDALKVKEERDANGK